MGFTSEWAASGSHLPVPDRMERRMEDGSLPLFLSIKNC